MRIKASSCASECLNRYRELLVDYFGLKGGLGNALEVSVANDYKIYYWQ